MTLNLTPIGIVHSCYKEKFGVPRQAGLVPHSFAEIEILPPYNRIEAWQELETSSHIWVQFIFHLNKIKEWKPKVKAPRLGGNKTIGVFATRSPIRPNPIGLSAVKLEKIHTQGEKIILSVSNTDLVDGTPVIDIKPYIPYCDRIEAASNDFADIAPTKYTVEFSETSEQKLTAYNQLKPLIIETLQLNPSPQYINHENDRIFGITIDQLNIKWKLISESKIEVSDIELI